MADAGGSGAGARILDISLDDSFARALPELSAPWQAMRPEDPAILALNDRLARELGLDPAVLRTESGVRFLLGNELPEGASPVAQAYAGHQFGGYSPRLGDGRALLLGEITDVSGRARDLHLKGSGPTPFARADGFAAVGPMLREYLMGEAMHALGIPTTRALAVIGTGRLIAREQSLDLLPGAVLVRVASTHLRVGSFQYARALGFGESGSVEPLRRLADFAIARHYPRLAESDDPYLGLLETVIAAQARLVASWMLVGFVHGVMNTDNMTISGETIDYGPCAFIDAYDPGAVFSSIDRGGRYAYGRQPAIALWNLTRFAEALLPLLGEDIEAAKASAEGALGGYEGQYNEAWVAGMRAKLGLARTTPRPKPSRNWRRACSRSCTPTASTTPAPSVRSRRPPAGDRAPTARCCPRARTRGVVRHLARPCARRRGDGRGQSAHHPAQSPGGGGARGRHRGGSRPLRSDARGRGRSLLRAPRSRTLHAAGPERARRVRHLLRDVSGGVLRASILAGDPGAVQPPLDGDAGGSRAIGHAELGDDVLDMPRHRGRRHAERAGDLRIRRAGGQVGEDLGLAGGERGMLVG